MVSEPFNNLHTLYFCYIDEFGTADAQGVSSHFVLCELSIPIYKWEIKNLTLGNKGGET